MFLHFHCTSTPCTTLAGFPCLHTSSHLHVVCSFDISVKASPLDVVHHTMDPEDPSHGVCLSMLSGSWNGNMLMNQPSPCPARPGASAAETSRWATFCWKAVALSEVCAVCFLTQRQCDSVLLYAQEHRHLLVMTLHQFLPTQAQQHKMHEGGVADMVIYVYIPHQTHNSHEIEVIWCIFLNIFGLLTESIV